MNDDPQQQDNNNIIDIEQDLIENEEEKNHNSETSKGTYIIQQDLNFKIIFHIVSCILNLRFSKT
jgi:hypothetical protein